VPAAASHREQCERNVKAYDTLGGEQAAYFEWPVTTLFYTGVHLAEEYFARLSKPLHSSGHRQRLQCLADRAPEAAMKLAILHNASRLARYDCAFRAFKESDVLRLRDIAAKEIPRALQLDALTM